VIIDVFRAFTTAVVAVSRGVSRIATVDSLDKALALRSSGVGDYCIGERESIKPPGFDLDDSPAELGKTLIQMTSNGTAGINAAHGTDRISAPALVTAEATVRAKPRGTTFNRLPDLPRGASPAPRRLPTTVH